MSISKEKSYIQLSQQAAENEESNPVDEDTLQIRCVAKVVQLNSYGGCLKCIAKVKQDQEDPEVDTCVKCKMVKCIDN